MTPIPGDILRQIMVGSVFFKSVALELKQKFSLLHQNSFTYDVTSIIIISHFHILRLSIFLWNVNMIDSTNLTIIDTYSKVSHPD